MRRTALLVLGLVAAGATLCLSLQAHAGTMAEATPAPTPAPNPEANQAMFFEGWNFKGNALTLQAGDEVPNLDKTRFGGWAERIKSLKLGTDVVVVMFVWFNYQGDCFVFRGANAGGVTGRYPDLSKYEQLSRRAKSVKVFLKTYPERVCQPSH